MAINQLTRPLALAAALALTVAGASHAQSVTPARGGAATPVGSTFPADFAVPLDDSLGKPVIGFGAAGPVRRTPVVFLHGNNDTPFATGCSSTHYMQAMAQHFADNGYSPSELWALGYQGDQCDLFVTGAVTADFGTGTDPTIRSSAAHTNAANVPDLRRFVRSVIAYTGARKVDIVAFGMGVTLAREWVRQDDAERLVRRFVAIEGPNRGMITCSAAADNPWALAFAGGYTPASPVCQELGSASTLFLKRLNASSSRIDADDTLVVRNTDASCLFKLPDGLGCQSFGPTPSLDSLGNPTDFSNSASLRGAKELGLSGQAGYALLPSDSAHMGIAYSPQTRQAAWSFLTRR